MLEYLDAAHIAAYGICYSPSILKAFFASTAKFPSRAVEFNDTCYSVSGGILRAGKRVLVRFPDQELAGLIVRRKSMSVFTTTKVHYVGVMENGSTRPMEDYPLREYCEHYRSNLLHSQ